MKRKVLLSFALIMLGCFSLKALGSVKMQELVPLVKIQASNDKVTFVVCLNEPFEKSNFEIEVMESLPPKVNLIVKSYPRSHFNTPRLIHLHYSFKELGLSPGSKFYLNNSFTESACT